eukprot:SAG11_NODE_661_length_7885_cov_8.956974_7_plen_159_part_00
MGRGTLARIGHLQTSKKKVTITAYAVYISVGTPSRELTIWSGMKSRAAEVERSINTFLYGAQELVACVSVESNGQIYISFPGAMQAINLKKLSSLRIYTSLRQADLDPGDIEAQDSHIEGFLQQRCDVRSSCAQLKTLWISYLKSLTCQHATSHNNFV